MEGFYKKINDNEYLYAPNFVYGKGYTLEKTDNRVSVDGWVWCNSAKEASNNLGINIADLTNDKTTINTYVESVKQSSLNLTQSFVLANQLTEAQYADLLNVYPFYKVAYAYKINDLFQYLGKLYKVVQAHTSQSDWKPDTLPALYTVITPAGVIPEWKEPTGSTDAYKIGDKVTYKGQVWVSQISQIQLFLMAMCRLTDIGSLCSMIVFFIALIGLVIWIWLNHKEDNVIEHTGYIPTDDNLDLIQSEFLFYVNNHREMLGLNPLIPDSLMGTLAIKRITEINKEKFSHYQFEWYQRELEKNGFVNVGELLSKEHNTVKSMFNNYLKSPKHRLYIEAKNITFVGLGIIISQNGNFNSCILIAESHKI